MRPRFTWDRHKATANLDKHSVAFEEAATVFQDPLAMIFDDEWHSHLEHRELIIGYSDKQRLLIIAFTQRNDLIRLISARKADRDERRDYDRPRT